MAKKKIDIKVTILGNNKGGVWMFEGWQTLEVGDGFVYIFNEEKEDTPVNMFRVDTVEYIQQLIVKENSFADYLKRMKPKPQTEDEHGTEKG